MFFAKKMILTLLAVSAAVAPTACADSDGRPNPLVILTAAQNNVAEVLTGVYDDGKSTVYIKVGYPSRDLEDDAVAELMFKKRKWEEKNPNKRVVAMAAVTADDAPDGYGHPVLAGLLIHYEQRQ